MRTCNYDFIEIGFRGNKWISGCKKEILYVTPLGVGEAVPPLPTDNGARFCTFCGKKIKLTSRKPKQYPAPPKATERPPKPDPLPRPVRVLEIGKEFNSYEGWQALGYQVQRGEKSMGRNIQGLALFHISQTKEIQDKFLYNWFDADDRPW